MLRDLDNPATPPPSIGAEKPVESYAERRCDASCLYGGKGVVRRGFRRRDQHSITAEDEAGRHISQAITDVEGPGEVDAMFSGGLPEKKCAGFAALACVFRRVSADVCCVDAGATPGKQFIEARRYQIVVAVGEHSATDSGLIRDNYDRDRRRIDAGNRLGGAVDQPYIIGS